MTYHYVVCKICGVKFNRDKEPFVMISGNRYAHKNCVEKIDNEQQKEELDLKKLESYIRKLFNEPNINAIVRKQIMNYRKDYGYSYSGILKTLMYWYDVKKNPTAAAHHNIGIVPYIWNEARDYYYALFLANNLNADKNIVDFIPRVKIIEIPPPRQKPKQVRLFDLGDDENEE